MLILLGLHRNNRSAVTIVELLVVVAIIGILVALLLPSVLSAREAARKSQCKNNLRQLILAMHSYHDANQVFPEAGFGFLNDRPGYLGKLLPFMESAGVDAQIVYDKSVNQAENKKIAEHSITEYVCPSLPTENAIDPAWRRIRKKEYSTSSYNAISGTDRVFPKDKDGNAMSATSDCGTPGGDGVIFANSKVRMINITDGTSKTLLLGERSYELRAWMRGPDTSGVCTTNVKTVVHPIINDIETLGDWFVYDNEGRTGGAIGFSNLPFGSFHPGGANFANADGSVEFLSVNTPVLLLQDRATIAGNEVIL